MNPGTTLFIVIGVIGLMLYLLKALRTSVHEAFTSDPKAQIIPSQLSDINSIMNVLGTPDLTSNPKLPFNPTPTDFSKLSISNVANPTPVPSLSISASLPALTAIPAPSDKVNVEAPIIPSIPLMEGKAETKSDQQGLAHKDILASKEKFETENSFKEAFNPKKKLKKPSRRQRRVKKCPPMPDMSLYIRKDKIPCWGCELK